MTDRELLELAAKAVGVCLHPESAIKRSYGNWGCDTTCMICKNDPRDARWNPITNDGDALRLAVKLGLLISHSAYKPEENAYGFIGIAWYGQKVKFESEKFTDDPYAATRRAIVRAAAEIGKEMK